MNDEFTKDRLLLINSIFKNFDQRVITYQICELCFKPQNLIMCDICKNYYHPKCLNQKEIPLKFTCNLCKDFTIEANGKNKTIEEKIINCSSYSINIHERKISSTDNTQENFEFFFCNRNFKETRKIKKDLKNMISDSIFPTRIKQNKNIEESNKRIIKHRKKRINNLDDHLRLDKSERNEIFTFDNSEVHYRKRKIKIGINHNLSMEEYYDKIENEMNLDEIDYERNDLKKVWSAENNQLSEEDFKKYLCTARIFWEYRNINIENELCADFFIDLDDYLKDNKINCFNKSILIREKVESLKKFLKMGINLNTHFDEMAMKILHICKYKTKVALLLLFKGINPYIEEIEEGFKTDVVFFQKEILSILSDDEV